MAVFEGPLSPPVGRIAIVAARFNQLVVDRLVEGAKSALARLGVTEDQIDLAWVPGSFELPLTAKTLAGTQAYAAILCLGAVIQGETDHYDYVCSQAAAGVLGAGLDTGVPVIFGVLTCDTLEQALNRAGGKAGNKGAEAAHAAVEMANLIAALRV